MSCVSSNLAAAPISNPDEWRNSMPLIQVQVIKDVFSQEQKRQIISKTTDAMVLIEGESIQIERARAIAEDPARLRRIKARSEIITARNVRIAERERVRREALARQAAERVAAEAAEAVAQAARKA